jgi:hypothetical protein
VIRKEKLFWKKYRPRRSIEKKLNKLLINLHSKKKKYKRSIDEPINRSIKISMKDRIKALRRRKKRGKEPFIIGVYDKKFIRSEEIIQARKRREELTYEIYRKYIPFKKKELIIKGKRSDKNRVHDVNGYLKLKLKIDNLSSGKDVYNDIIQSKNDKVVDEPLAQSPLKFSNISETCLATEPKPF